MDIETVYPLFRGKPRSDCRRVPVNLVGFAPRYPVLRTKSNSKTFGATQPRLVHEAAPFCFHRGGPQTLPAAALLRPEASVTDHDPRTRPAAPPSAQRSRSSTGAPEHSPTSDLPRAGAKDVGSAIDVRQIAAHAKFINPSPISPIQENVPRMHVCALPPGAFPYGTHYGCR